MENKKQVGASSLDHLFGPKDSSSSSSSSSNGIFGSIFQPPSKMLGRHSASAIMGNRVGDGKYGNPDNISQMGKGESSGVSDKDKNLEYQNETAEPCYFSSSIYYGGQENYSPRTRNVEYHQNKFKKDNGDDDPNVTNSNSASRGNWWQGSLYY